MCDGSINTQNNTDQISSQKITSHRAFFSWSDHNWHHSVPNPSKESSIPWTDNGVRESAISMICPVTVLLWMNNWRCWANRPQSSERVPGGSSPLTWVCRDLKVVALSHEYAENWFSMALILWFLTLHKNATLMNCQTLFLCLSISLSLTLSPFISLSLTHSLPFSLSLSVSLSLPV